MDHAPVSEALTLAADIHREQRRKGTDIPYLAHLLGVAALVVEHGGNAVQATGALLHDAIEDHPDKITLAQIEQSFGGEVAAIVLACTDAMEHPKPPWRARKEAYIAHLAQAPPAAWLVSCADKLHNARAIRDDLVEIGPAVFDRFSARPEEVLWYYRTLADTFARLMPGQLATRLAHTVGEIERLWRDHQPAT
jgi:(p)ppGpp synthase/HD superfamily hydrolase